MALLCYNKGCGQEFHAAENGDGEIPSDSGAFESM